MKKLRLFLCSLLGWPLGMAVESALLTCWPLYLYLWLGLGWRWYAALPALAVGWVGANLIGLAFLRCDPLPPFSTAIREALPVYHFPRWLWLFDNDEDGVGGPWVGRNGNERRWCERAKHWPLWLRVLSWQFRNPIANLRRSAWGVKLDAARVESVGNCRRPDRDFEERIEREAEQFNADLRAIKAGRYVSPPEFRTLESAAAYIRDAGGPLYLWARQGWRVGFWMVRPSRRWRTITHSIGWRVFAFDPALDRPVDQHQGFKFQPWRRG